ncbi:MAG: hypothetical protein LBB87_01665 [Nitrososphaerota archaeon]|jgi:hypothetical protein|nr:hypothetical protein [Nitrososphaerota archaeon]
MRKCTVLLLITVLVVSGLIVHAVPSVTAQAGYKPSVPQFSVEPVFIGELVDTIFVTIENQPFTSYKDVYGYEYKLFYRVQIRLEGEQNWRPLFGDFQSDSQYTSLGLAKYGVLDLGLNSLPTGSQLDFRVIAEIEYYSGSTYVLEASSGWSDVHTITLSDEAASFPPSQTVTYPPVTSNGGNSQPQYSGQTQLSKGIFSNSFVLFGAVALFTGVVLAVVLVFFRRQPKSQCQEKDLYV